MGFDTAVKVYSQLVGNTAIDGASARKYWYFMRLMGQVRRSRDLAPRSRRESAVNSGVLGVVVLRPQGLPRGPASRGGLSV